MTVNVRLKYDFDSLKENNERNIEIKMSRLKSQFHAVSWHLLDFYIIYVAYLYLYLCA